METSRTFNPGDFVKRSNRKGSFMIYEGKDVSNTYAKKLTLAVAYDPEKYMQKPNSYGYEYVPYLDEPKNGQACETTIDTDKEDNWISLCTQEEKEEAIEILEQYGYVWDEENLALVDMVTGEIIKKIYVPDNKYHGETIKPITNNSKDVLKKFCIDKNKKTYSSYYNHNYQCSDYWD